MRRWWLVTLWCCPHLSRSGTGIQPTRLLFGVKPSTKENATPMVKSTKRNKSTKRKCASVRMYLALTLYTLAQGTLGFVELVRLTPSMC